MYIYTDLHVRICMHSLDELKDTSFWEDDLPSSFAIKHIKASSSDCESLSSVSELYSSCMTLLASASAISICVFCFCLLSFLCLYIQCISSQNGRDIFLQNVVVHVVITQACIFSISRFLSTHLF